MNPFEALGVSPDADPQELKRAYARKVREHPPESDPEGFQRICDAFEQLRDPEQRARFAETVARPELGLMRQRYAEARRAGTNAKAAAVLDEVIAKYPDLREVREEQVRFLAAIGRAADAIERGTALCAQHPNDVSPLLLLADVYAGTYEYEKAREAVAAARALAPNDRRPLITLAQMSEQMQKLNDAAEHLGAALALDDRRFVSDTELIGRKVLLFAQGHLLDSANAEIARLVTGAQSDEEKQSTATLLTTLAGWVLTNGKAQRVALAASMFEHAHRLDPTKHRFTLAARSEGPIERLTAPAQQHVDATRAERPARVLQLKSGRGVLRSALALAGWTGLVVLGVRLLLPGDMGVAHAAAFVTSLVLIASYFTLEPPQGFDYLELRPLHLLRVKNDRIAVLPLLRLVKVVAHDSGSVSLMLEGGDEVLLEAPQGLMPFLQAMAQQIDRLAMLAASDLLETEVDREALRWDLA